MMQPDEPEKQKKNRKPYTLTKQRESWTNDEHERFIKALQLYNRDWKKIESYVGTKTVVQIRSHAQKYFQKVLKSGQSTDAIPPPRPKRRASDAPLASQASSAVPDAKHMRLMSEASTRASTRGEVDSDEGGQQQNSKQLEAAASMRSADAAEATAQLEASRAIVSCQGLQHVYLFLASMWGQAPANHEAMLQRLTGRDRHMVVRLLRVLSEELASISQQQQQQQQQHTNSRDNTSRDGTSRDCSRDAGTAAGSAGTAAAEGAELEAAAAAAAAVPAAAAAAVPAAAAAAAAAGVSDVQHQAGGAADVPDVDGAAASTEAAAPAAPAAAAAAAAAAVQEAADSTGPEANSSATTPLNQADAAVSGATTSNVNFGIYGNAGQQAGHLIGDREGRIRCILGAACTSPQGNRGHKISAYVTWAAGNVCKECSGHFCCAGCLQKHRHPNGKCNVSNFKGRLYPYDVWEAAIQHRSGITGHKRSRALDDHEQFIRQSQQYQAQRRLQQQLQQLQQQPGYEVHPEHAACAAAAAAAAAAMPSLMQMGGGWEDQGADQQQDYQMDDAEKEMMQNQPLAWLNAQLAQLQQLQQEQQQLQHEHQQLQMQREPPDFEQQQQQEGQQQNRYEQQLQQRPSMRRSASNTSQLEHQQQHQQQQMQGEHHHHHHHHQQQHQQADQQQQQQQASSAPPPPPPPPPQQQQQLMPSILQRSELQRQLMEMRAAQQREREQAAVIAGNGSAMAQQLAEAQREAEGLRQVLATARQFSQSVLPAITAMLTQTKLLLALGRQQEQQQQQQQQHQAQAAASSG
ncbi:hypothetical protein OEZ85_005010 [Tetradesmus obliquus]|uniref:Uncharacterized protein n=1 Tax=Tetradesmus obliquus TaxID=3088 RepID=A0ABY8UHW6_TETOB|nr:hypothetical protein OEZ85_005010 [Tetradesmus obliquus]